MKKIIITAFAALLAAACIPDDRNNNMVPDGFGLTSPVVTEASVHTGVLKIGINKSGVGQTAATVAIYTDGNNCQPSIDEYNAANGTSYKPLSISFINLDKTKLSFEAKDASQAITLSWDPGKVADAIGDDPDFVIPILLKSDNIDVNKGHGFMMVHLNRSGIAVTQKSLSREVEAKNVEADKDGNQPELQEIITLDVTISPAIKGMGMSIPVSIDNSLVAEFNKTQETPFAQAPDVLVTIVDQNAVIAEGSVGGSFKVLFDKSKLLSGGKLVPFPGYVIPIRLQADKLSATLGGEAFSLQGLSVGNTVTYLTVTYYQPPQGLSIRRVWGKYSTSADAWSSYMPGFTANSDRNVSLDGNYIYIAETNTTKHLWAISLQDPETYKLLPVGTVADAGIFNLSCPRVLKNSDETINGGNDVLVVSNMIEGDPTLYFYVNGIDADPVAVKANTWASRRLGDTFTYYGTLQDGVFFFKDFNSAQGTVTFPLKFKATTANVYLTARLVAPAVTGAGAYFPYPGDNGHGVCSVRGEAVAQLVSTDANFLTKEGAVTPTLTDLNGYYTNTAFRFIEFKGKRYIAYTRQVSSADGRLFVIKGDASESWASILDKRDVVYHAAIQNDSEQDGIDETPSPMYSGNSGMDLDTYVTDDAVFIAVVKQNVGLSLFELTDN